MSTDDKLWKKEVQRSVVAIAADVAEHQSLIRHRSPNFHSLPQVCGGRVRSKPQKWIGTRKNIFHKAGGIIRAASPRGHRLLVWYPYYCIARRSLDEVRN